MSLIAVADDKECCIGEMVLDKKKPKLLDRSLFQYNFVNSKSLIVRPSIEPGRPR